VPDTIKAYIISFGDGAGASATDGQSPVWTHTYAASGNYVATLRVTDSRGKGSDNAAQKAIEVGPATATATASVGNNVLGGSFPLGSLLVLSVFGGLGLQRRARKP
jgi:PKD repeat protein